MNTNALRQKILDLAIHGKLVKQDSADEPASVMLEKLRAEKEAKIATGEIKRNKNDSYIFKYTGTSGESKTDDNPAGLEHNRHYEKFSDGRVKDIEDEIPFAVPEGWAWCRLGEICEFKGGGTPDKLDLSYWGGNLNWASVKDIKGKFLYSTEDKITELGLKNSAANLAKIDDIILITRILPGKAIITKIETAINQDLKIVLPKIEIEKQFLLYFFNYVENDFFEKSNGTTVKGIKLECLTSTAFPLPPLSEQKRIVTAIEAIFTQIELLEQNKIDLQTAVKQAKSKILDLAIRGKLVPQDRADEPASVMLERLRAEKEAKIAAGEIKRSKNNSYIYKNSTDNCYYEKFIDGTEEQIEIPFNLPESWCWQKISSICEINPKNKLDDTLEISFVPMTLINSEFNNNFTYKLQKWKNVKSGFSHFSDNDIGIAKITPCFENRKSVIFKNLKNKYGAGTTELHILRTNNKYIFNEYVFWFIKTDAFIKEGINNFTGAVGQQRIGKEFIAETLIPIPPLNEQRKICNSIHELMKKLDEIILNL